MRVWDAQTGREIHALKGHTKRVTCVAYSPDGSRIASAGDDGTVRVWDAQTGLETLSLTERNSELTSAAFSPDGQRLVTGCGDGKLKVWDARRLDGEARGPAPTPSDRPRR